MSGRPIRPAYLPPHMRSAAHAAEGAPRSLEELAPQSIKIKIEFTQSSPFSFDLCPDNFVEESTEADSSNAQQQQQPAAGSEPLQQQEHSAATLQPAGSIDDQQQQQQQQSPPTQADQAAAEPAGPGTTAPTGDPGTSHAAAMEPGQSPAEPGAAAGVQPGPESEPGTNQPEGGGATAGASVPRKKLPLECRYLLSPACPDTYQIKQLLRWFREACREESDDFPKGDTRAVLSLPASLSKRERAMWHQEAERLALKSQSTGFGEDRFLQIRPSGNYSSKSSWPSWNKPHGGPGSGGSSSSRGHGHPYNAPRGPRSHAAAAADGPEANPGAEEAQPLSPTAAAAAANRQPGDPDGEGFPEDQQQQQQLAGDDGSSSHRQQQRQQWGSRGGSSGRGGGGTGGGGRRPPDFAKQLWDWCQLEGGALWNYSQGEIKDALAAVGGDMDKLPPELAALVAKRRFSQRLAAALQSRDESTACIMLAECDPTTRLGWVRDPESGGYPAHIAAWHGLSDFLMKLVERDGAEILQQHDASRATPLQLAQQRGHTELAAALEQLHLQARGGSSGGTPSDVPPAPGERGFTAGAAGATAAAADADAEVGDVAAGAAGAAPVAGPTAGGGRGFGRAGFSRGRGRGSSAAPRPAAAAAAGESMGEAGGSEGDSTAAAAGAADTVEVLGQAGNAGESLDAATAAAAAAVSSGAAVTTDDSSKAADQGDADQQQQQQEESRASQEQQADAQQAEAANATAPAAAAAAPKPAPGSDHYCSYANRDDRSYTLYGRPAGRAGGGGGHYRGRGGGGRGGRWQGRGGWHGRGHGGWHGRGRGRGSSAEGGGHDGGTAEGGQQQSEQ